MRTRQEALAEGLPRYFTGEACKRGHKAERVTLSGGCVECIRESKDRERQVYAEAKAANGG